MVTKVHACHSILVMQVYLHTETLGPSQQGLLLNSITGHHPRLSTYVMDDGLPGSSQPSLPSFEE